MFVCWNGFAPTPKLKDLVPESRMEKVLHFRAYKNLIENTVNVQNLRNSSILFYSTIIFQGYT